MKLNYTKATKQHIAQMAVRKKYLDIFNEKLSKMEGEFLIAAEKEGDHVELSKLPAHLHGNFNYTDQVTKYGRKLFTVDQYIALQTRENHHRINLHKKVFVKGNELCHLIETQSHLIVEFGKFLKEIDQFASDAYVSLDSYSTYEKALNALPWIEGLHPDKDKAAICKLVPIDIINKVNELMSGVK